MSFDEGVPVGFAKRIFVLLLVGLSVMAAGCTRPNDPMLDMLEADLKKTKVDDLSRTMDFVFAEIRFEQREFKEKLESGLNRWVSYSDKKLDRFNQGSSGVAWSEDALSKPLFEENKTLAMLARNAEYSFLSTDAYYLQESAWISQIVDRVVASSHLNAFELYRLAADNYKPDEDVEEPVVEVVKKLHPQLSEDASLELTNSLKVFDWIMRNVQLLPETIVSDDELAEVALNDNQGSRAARGVGGLGYQRYPWQSLLYGRADYVERAKLFMVALRHLGIDSVMFQPRGDGAKPWAVGVAIGDNYYLFDTKMALPIPGKKVGTIATLAELRSDDELLTKLDLTTDESLEDDTAYWVKPEDIKQLDALVYVTPESISKRMLALEKSLIGEERLTLVFTGDQTINSAPQADGVEFKAWDIAFQTHYFRQAVREALEQTSDFLREKLGWHYSDEAYIDNFIVYRTTRARFFNGKFQSDPDSTSRNAIESCQRLMYDDEDVESLGSDKRLQAILGIRKEADQSAQSFLQEVRSVQNQMRLVRRDAGFFLSQCLFDNSSVNAAKNWLNVLRAEEDAERWNDGVTYLLGRSLESCKEYDESIKVLSDPKSTQALGNIVRTRLLKELISNL